jgi:ribosomal protein S7
LIEAANVKESLEMSPIGDKITNESQARELAKVPEGKREKVIKQIVKDGDLVTAETIKEKAAEIVGSTNGQVATPAMVNVSRNVQPKDEIREEPRDEVGYKIPAKLMELWKRKAEVQTLMADIQQLKREISQIEKDGDSLYAPVNFTTVQHDLHNAWKGIQQAIPYAVCTVCNGRVEKSCSFCKGRGIISKFAWDSCVDDDTKALRSKLVKI